MEEKRQALLDTLLDALYGATERLRAGICGDACDSLLLGSLVRQMKAIDLLQPRPPSPVCGVSVVCVTSDIAKLTTPKTVVKEKKSSAPSSISIRTVDHCEGNSCTLGELFSNVRGLVDGVKGLDVEAVLG